jgi:hypothetical protein
MPIDAAELLRMTLQIIKTFRWLFAALFYTAMIALFKIYGLILITLFFAAVGYAYYIDQKRESKGMDDFRGRWLFFRYGEEVDRSVFSIPADRSWGEEETILFAQSLRESLGAALRVCLPADTVKVDADRTITDQETGDRKIFLRVLVRSKFGSMLTHFVHYAAFGRTITAHYFTYVRGPQSDWELIKFVFLSPLTILSWGFPWLLNRYSILSEISKYRASSFDGMDLQTMYSLTHKVLFEETERLLSKAGLLTEELKQALHVHINKQTIQVNGSSGVSFGNVNQLTPSPTRV